jgi:hypothetical protein
LWNLILATRPAIVKYAFRGQSKKTRDEIKPEAAYQIRVTGEWKWKNSQYGRKVKKFCRNNCMGIVECNALKLEFLCINYVEKLCVKLYDC